MEIKKKSFFIRTAYMLARDEDVPESTSLCELFWRFIFMFFISIPFICVIGVIVFGFLFIIGLPFAARPTILNGDDLGKMLAHYERWPKIMGHKVYPIWVIIIIFALINFSTTMEIIYGITKATILQGNFWIGVVIIIASIVAFIATCGTISRINNSGILEIFKEFLKAKKQKICPIIEIVE